MGNIQLANKKSDKRNDPSRLLKQYFIESLVLHQSRILFENEIFKTFRVILERNYGLIMKVYFKLDSSDFNPMIKMLEDFSNQLNYRECPFLLPFSKIENHQDFVLGFRQEMHSTLTDKIKSNIFIESFEKYWIISQIAFALKYLHSRNFFHGNLKPSNILLTSQSYVFLTDFALYKPLYLPDQNLLTLRWNYCDYKDSIRQMPCYFAPEKFITDSNIEMLESLNQLKEKEGLADSLQKMDIFSFACIIYEVILNKTLFSFEDLQDYRRGTFTSINLKERLSQLENSPLEELLFDMLSIEPQKRGSIEEILPKLTSIFNIDGLELLYFIETTLQLPEFVIPDSKIHIIKELLPFLIKSLLKMSPEEFGLALLDPLPYQNLITKKIFLNLFAKWNPIYDKDPKKFVGEFFDDLTRNPDLRWENCLKLATKFTESPNEGFDGEKVFLENSFFTILSIYIMNTMKDSKYVVTLVNGLEILWKISPFISSTKIFCEVLPFVAGLITEHLERNSVITSAAFKSLCTLLRRTLGEIKNKNNYKFLRNIFYDIFRKLSGSENYLELSTLCIYLSQIAEFLQLMTSKITLFEDSEKMKAEQKFFSAQILNILCNFPLQNNTQLILISLQQLKNLMSINFFSDYIETDRRIFLFIMECMKKLELKGIDLEAISSSLQFTKTKSLRTDIVKCAQIFLLNSNEKTVEDTLKFYSSEEVLPETVDSLRLIIYERSIPLTLHPNKWISESAKKLVIRYLHENLKKMETFEFKYYFFLGEILSLNPEFKPSYLTLDPDTLALFFPKAISRENYDFLLKQKDSPTVPIEDPINKLFFYHYINYYSKSSSKTPDNWDQKPNITPYKISQYMSNLIKSLLINQILFLIELSEYNAFNKDTKPDDLEKALISLEEKNGLDSMIHLKSFLRDIRDLVLSKFEKLLSNSEEFLDLYSKILNVSILECSSSIAILNELESQEKVNLGKPRPKSFIGKSEKLPQEYCRTIFSGESTPLCLESLGTKGMFLVGTSNGEVLTYKISEDEM